VTLVTNEHAGAQQAEGHQGITHPRLHEDECRQQQHHAAQCCQGLAREPTDIAATDDAVDGEHQSSGQCHGPQQVEAFPALYVRQALSGKSRRHSAYTTMPNGMLTRKTQCQSSMK